MANIRVARRSGRVLRGGRMRRDTLWAFLAPSQTSLAAASTAALINSPNAAQDALRPYTVIRVRGTLHVQSDQSAASEFYQASLGMCVVTDQALAIGITAVPTPETDRGSDAWLLYETLESQFLFGDGTGFITAGIRKDFDSRGMRKVEDQQAVIAVIETSSGSGGVVVAVSGRVLLKLH